MGSKLAGSTWTMRASRPRRWNSTWPATAPPTAPAPAAARRENENIVVVEVALKALAALADRQALADLKTFALLQTLRIRRPDLFA